MVQFEEDNPDDLLGNMVVLGISLIVIAAVVIGVVAGIEHHSDAPVKSERMTLDAVCDQTDYKVSCMATLLPVGNYAEVLTYFKAAVDATISELVRAVDKARFDIADDPALDQTENMALEDCIELIDLCIEELQSVIEMVNTTANLFYTDSADARLSLSAVLSYQRACFDGLKESRSTTSGMDGGLQKITELASNALAIIYENSENDDVEADQYSAAFVQKADSYGIIYPNRVSAADRKLLQYSYNKGRRLQMMPHAVVAKDGSGQYASINAALSAYPYAHKGRYLVYVKSGVYEENVIVFKNTTQIFMYGDGVNKTIISGRDFQGTTYRRATLSVIGNGFICNDIGIEIPDKSRGNSMAAVRIQSNSAAFFNCRINGSTTSSIYALAQRQFFIDCEIYGVTNIIRGDAAVVIQRSKIIVTQASAPILANIIALQGRSDKRESSGFVIHGCTIKADESEFPNGLENAAYLGMAVEKYSRTIVMESYLGDLIHPDGWYNNNNYGIETVTFAEYRNRGPGAGTNKRVNWPGYSVIVDRNEALRYTAGRFIRAQKWLQGTQVPLQAALFS